MVYCRGCGKPIHSSAPSCPHCGAPQRVESASSGSKGRITAAVLALLLGGFGIHKFYTGAWGWGLVYMALFWTGIPAILAWVEAIRYFVLSDAEFEHKSEQATGPFGFIW